MVPTSAPVSAAAVAVGSVTAVPPPLPEGEDTVGENVDSRTLPAYRIGDQDGEIRAALPVGRGTQDDRVPSGRSSWEPR